MGRPSPALLVALLALIVALTGTATAGRQALLGGADIRNNSLTGADIRNSSLTGADIRNNSIRGVDVRNGSIALRDLAPAARRALSVVGPQGPAGPRGLVGDTGPQGPPALADLELVGGPVRPIASGGNTLFGIDCPDGKVAISAGWEQTNATGTGASLFGGTNDDITVHRSRRSDDGRSWLFAVENPAGVERYFREFVLCATVAG